MIAFDDLRYDRDGLVPIVIQDVHDGTVLTLAYANREALERTLATGQTYLYSRSRAELWHKGATSGNVQRLVHMLADCDSDAVIYCVDPAGPACHTGARSCFNETVAATSSTEKVSMHEEPVIPAEGTFEAAFMHLRTVLKARRQAPVEESYVAKLFSRGVDLIAKKIGEEATEVVIAAKNADHKEIIW